MSFSAKQILAMSEPSQLFSNSLDKSKAEYTELVKTWHPDRNANSQESNDVMTKINALYRSCVDLLSSGKWKEAGLVRFKYKTGELHELRYRTSHDFELGTMYIGNKVLIYLLNEEHKDLFQNAISSISNFKYADAVIKERISRCLPNLLTTFETDENQLGLVLEKTPDLLLLRDVLTYYNGAVPERHVAWIITRLLNLSGYLDNTNLSHNAISIDNCFISPEFHSCAILGGWWYSVQQHTKMLGVPELIYSVMPPRIKVAKQGSITTDLESIRLIGRQLLGDPSGASLYTKKDIPEPMITFLRGVASDKAVTDIQKWQDTLTASFGPRKFVPMDLDHTKLYAKVKK